MVSQPVLKQDVLTAHCSYLMLKPEGVSVILWFVKRKPTFKTARLKRENVSYGLIRGLLEDILFIYLFFLSYITPKPSQPSHWWSQPPSQSKVQTLFSNVKSTALCLHRPLARVWTVVLLLGTCLLYCARVAMPICAVSLAEKFSWSKKESGMVLGSFFWGYCFTQVFGGYVSDR